MLGFQDGLVISDVSELTSAFICNDRTFILLIPHLPLKIKAPRSFANVGDH